MEGVHHRMLEELAARGVSWDTISAIRDQATEIVDSGWHYSWHWDRSEGGGLSEKGWQQCLDDAVSLRKSLAEHVAKLDELVPKLRDVIDYYDVLRG